MTIKNQTLDFVLQMAIKTTSHDLNLDDMNKQDQSARWKRKWENELKPSDHVSKGSRNHKKAILLYMLSSALFAFSMIGNFVSNLRTDFIAATVNNPISNNDLLDLSPNFVSDVNITTCEPLKVVEEIVIEDNLEQIKIFSEQISELKRLSLELSMTNSRLTEYIHQYNNLTHAVFAISSQIEYVTKRQGDIRGHLNSLEDSVTNIRALEAAVNLYPARLSTLDSRLSDIASIRISAEKHILINHNLQQRSESYSRMVAQSLKHAESIHKSYELRLRALEHENNILVESCNLSRIQNIIYDSLSHMREEEVEDDRKRVATYQTEESEAVFHENILTNVSMPWIDFASAKLGGEIVTSMTSATYFPKNAHPPSLDFLSSLRIPTDSAALIFKMIYGTLGIDLGVGKPEDAIDEDMSLGSCWPLQVKFFNYFSELNKI